MGKQKLEVTRQLQRIAALPFNPFFKEEARRIRENFGIPGEQKEAVYWLKKYKQAYERRKTRGNIAKSTIPLHKEILALLSRFGVPLPLIEFNLLEIYIVYPIDPLLHLSIMGAPFVYIRPDPTVGLPYMKVEVYGISMWTTKKDWERVWDNKVNKEVREMKVQHREITGESAPGRKGMSLESLYNRMERWSEWYRLSEVEDLGPTKALVKWEEEHSDERGKFDQSTVTHAIKDFKEIITPVPVNNPT